MIKQITAGMERSPVRARQRHPLMRHLENIAAKKRMGSVALYASGALLLAVICSFAFNSMGRDTEFAIAVMGSLIGGFLGAMLAAALIVDIYSPDSNKEEEQEG